MDARLMILKTFFWIVYRTVAMDISIAMRLNDVGCAACRLSWGFNVTKNLERWLPSTMTIYYRFRIKDTIVTNVESGKE